MRLSLIFMPMPWLAVLMAGCDSPSTEDPVRKSVFALEESDFSASETFELPAPDGWIVATGIEVTKGEALLLRTTGRLTTEVGVVGPDGSREFHGGTPFLLGNRPAFGVYGRVGAAWFPVGYDSVLLAPATGALDLLVNGCDNDSGEWSIDCGVEGTFVTKVHRSLRDGVEIAETPLLSDDTIESSAAFELDASGEWQGSGVRVKRGQKVLVSASGTIEAAALAWSEAATYDPNGSESWTGNVEPLTPVPGDFAYRLFGRVGETIIDIGNSSAFLAPTAGEFEFVINHFHNASGTIAVDIDLGVVPAHGLLDVDVASLTQQDTREVLPDAEWVETAVQVEKGDPMAFSASGELTGAALMGPEPHDPYGNGWYGGTLFALINRAAHGLFGRVGEQVFYLGGQNVLLAPASGPVELIINGAVNCDACVESCSPESDVGTCLECDPWCDIAGTFDATVSAPER